MGQMSFQAAVAFALTCFAGTLMFLYGVSANLLERRPTRCRHCGGRAGSTCICGRDD